jgi:hypothetical protein
MTALSANQVINTLNSDWEGAKCDYQCAAEVIYKNGFVGLNATGYLTMLTPSASATTISGDRFIGISLDYVDNSGGSAGDKTCQVLVAGRFRYALTSAAILDIGCPVFASDDNTLTKDDALGPYIGMIEQVPASGYVNVAFDTRRFSGIAVQSWTTPDIDLTTASDLVRVFHPTENHNGILLLGAGGVVVTAVVGSSEDQPVITFRDSDGTAIGAGVAFTGTNTTPDAVGDMIGVNTAANLALGAATLNVAAPIVAADKGLDAFVTTAAAGTPAGVYRFWAIGIPFGG